MKMQIHSAETQEDKKVGFPCTEHIKARCSSHTQITSTPVCTSSPAFTESFIKPLSATPRPAADLGTRMLPRTATPAGRKTTGRLLVRGCRQGSGNTPSA